MFNQPHLHQHDEQGQPFGTVIRLPLGLSHEARLYASQRLNRLLADSLFLYSLYKKHHWQVHGPSFAGLHLLFDSHAAEQLALVDALAERVQTLGGVAVGDPRHAAEITAIPRPPDGTEDVSAMISRLLEAHEIVLNEAREAAADIAARSLGDEGTVDLLVSQVIRTGENQVWMLAEHLVVASTHN